MLVSSIFSLSHNFFKIFSFPGLLKVDKGKAFQNPNGATVQTIFQKLKKNYN